MAAIATANMRDAGAISSGAPLNHVGGLSTRWPSAPSDVSTSPTLGQFQAVASGSHMNGNYPGAESIADTATSPGAERPQVLAQLAKDISDLIHSTRGAQNGERSQHEASGSNMGSPRRGGCMAGVGEGLAAASQAQSLARDRRSSFESSLGEMRSTSQASQAHAMNGPPIPRLRGVPDMSNVSSGSAVNGCDSHVVSPHAQQFSAERGYVSKQDSDIALRQQRDVHNLLASIEGRESALRQKVQELSDEKASQQQRLEDELSRLQARNARVEDELWRYQQNAVQETAPTYFSSPSCNTTQTQQPQAFRGELPTRPHLHEPTSRGLGELTSRSLGEAASGSVGEDRRLDPQLQLFAQDVRKEVNHQLTDIRGEVARCAAALGGQEALPVAEVADIRQQLAALSNEVLQTSRSLLSSAGAWDGCGSGISPDMSGVWQGQKVLQQPCVTGNSRDHELAEIRQQLGTLQGQVSSAMAITLSGQVPCDRAGVTERAPLSPHSADVRARELSHLRNDVDALRGELARASQNARGAQPADAVTMSAQRYPPDYLAQQPLPQQPYQQARGTDVGSQIDALRSEISCLRQPEVECAPPSIAEDSANAAKLHGRLSALRAEVARVIQEQALAGNAGTPEMGAQLNALFAELHDLRRGAATLASSPPLDGQMPHEQVLSGSGRSLPWGAIGSQGNLGSRPGTPSRYVSRPPIAASQNAYVPLGDTASGISSRYVDMGPCGSAGNMPAARYLPSAAEKQYMLSTPCRNGVSASSQQPALTQGQALPSTWIPNVTALGPPPSQYAACGDHARIPDAKTFAMTPAGVSNGLHPGQRTPSGGACSSMAAAQQLARANSPAPTPTRNVQHNGMQHLHFQTPVLQQPAAAHQASAPLINGMAFGGTASFTGSAGPLPAEPLCASSAPQDRPRRPSRTKLQPRWQDDGTDGSVGGLGAARAAAAAAAAVQVAQAAGGDRGALGAGQCWHQQLRQHDGISVLR